MAITPSPRYCSECGAALDSPGAKFCSECGAPCSAPPASRELVEADPRPARRSGGHAGRIVAVAAIVVVVALFVALFAHDTIAPRDDPKSSTRPRPSVLTSPKPKVSWSITKCGMKPGTAPGSAERLNEMIHSVEGTVTNVGIVTADAFDTELTIKVLLNGVVRGNFTAHPDVDIEPGETTHWTLDGDVTTVVESGSECRLTDTSRAIG